VKTSLDISLQTATRSKTLKAEVQMADLIYDLKIYTREDKSMVHQSSCEGNWDLIFNASDQTKVRWAGGRLTGGPESEEESSKRENVDVRVKTLDQLLYKYIDYYPDYSRILR